MDVVAALATAPYPGRGLIVGRSGEGLVALYWVTGRSEASRQRRFVAGGEDLTVESTTGADDDPLRHYRASARFGRHFILGNGSHVDALGVALQHMTGVEAFESIEPEPDPPINTPRIAAVVDVDAESLLLGAARRAPDGNSDRLLCSARVIPAGAGVLLATYSGPESEPRPWAVPTWVDIDDSLERQAAVTWSALAPRLRVALATCVVGRPWRVDVQNA